MARKFKDLALAPEAFWSKWPYDYSRYYVHPKKCMNPYTLKWRWIRFRNAGMKRLLRELDGTVYAFRCPTCHGCWKVYQNAYHGFNCPHAAVHEELKEAVARGVRIAEEGRTARKGR